MGWDNLQTDLAPWLGVKRAFFSVWQEYQSFGLVAGMAHGADLVRSVMVWLLSFILPQSLIRYSLTFLLVLTGTLGMAQLLKLSGLKKEKYPFAIVGALFYLLNYATVQILFLPYESYVFLYAFLPWEVWIYLRIISVKSTTKKEWLWFILINILATSQAVAQQLFVVYGLVLACMTFGVFAIHKARIKLIRRVFFSAVLIFVINSFWLFPQLYFLKTAGDVVTESKMNQLATENVFYQNLEKGGIQDFTTLTGFFNELTDRKSQLLFKEWRIHREDPVTLPLILLFVILPFLGMFSRSTYRLPFLILYILTSIALLSNTTPFDLLNTLLRNNYFINQIFRSPFTKFVIPYSLVISFFVAYAFLKVSQWTEKIDIGPRIISFFGCSMIILYALPSFFGYYISPEMKVKLPQEYRDTIQYFQSIDKNKRIALFPDYTYWGWFFHNWGYNGSGFLWYGIEQPMISRTFDVWSFPSESYYWEIKYAVESENVQKTEDVLRKYNVNYLIVDYSLEPVASSYQSLQYDRTENILKKSKLIKQVSKNKYLAIYEFTDTKSSNFISQSESLQNGGPKVKIMHDDILYEKYGAYKTDQSKQYVAYAPFLDLMSQTRMKDKNWDISIGDKTVQFTSDLPFDAKEYTLETTEIPEKTEIFDDSLLTFDNDMQIVASPDQSLVVTIPKQIMRTFDIPKTFPATCVSTNGTLNFQQFGAGVSIETQDGATGCFSYNGNFDQQYGYLLEIDHYNLKGRSLFFYILDSTKKQTVLEDRLQGEKNLFLIHPKFQYGKGYTFTFHNNSYQQIPSENVLQKMTLYYIPYDSIQKLFFVRNNNEINKPSVQTDTTAYKNTYYSYETTIKDSDSDIILYQSFDPGWIAYGFKNKPNQLEKHLPFINNRAVNLKHFFVNNWANGWSSQKDYPYVIIIFWPQYLQFAGLILLTLTTLGVLILPFSKKRLHE